MTFSVVARGPDGASFGIAVASKFLAVGAAVPAAAAGVGALATQSYANLAYKADGLALLRTGLPAEEVVTRLTAADPQREHRQLGVVDRNGTGATYTGQACHPWAGGRSGPGYAMQGNILASEAVLESMESAWLGTEASSPLAHRLLGALVAGDGAGGDRRGRQSAALLVVAPGAGYGGGDDVLVDLRVDDHPRPLEELVRLLGLHELYFGQSAEADMLPLAPPLLAEVAGLLGRAGHPPASSLPTDVLAALQDWAGVENLEERTRSSDSIDPLVLGSLRAAAAP